MDTLLNDGLRKLRQPIRTVRELKLYVRNSIGRYRNNFGICDRWDFFTANAEAQVKALKWLRDHHAGYPTTLLPTVVDADNESTVNKMMDEWAHILQAMIDGWQAILDIEKLEYDENHADNYNALRQRFRDGMALYIEYYEDLWD